MTLGLLTLYEDEQRVTVQLVYLNHIWTRFLCKNTHDNNNNIINNRNNNLL